MEMKMREQRGANESEVAKESRIRMEMRNEREEVVIEQGPGRQMEED